MKRWWLWIALCPMAALAADPFVVGACAHFGQGKGRLTENLSLMRQAGIASFRDEVSWHAIEKTKGQYEMPAAWDEFIDQGRKAGLDPLLILDYGNPLYDAGDKPRSPEAVEAFTKYAEFVVRHFKGRVMRYEVWNEWDIAIGGTKPGSGEDYAVLLKSVYPRIKAIDPTITVYGGAPTLGGVKGGWLEKILEHGALANLDVLSIHTYMYSASGRARTPEAWAEWMAQVQALAAKHNDGKPVPMAVTEMGWPTELDRRGTPPEVAAAYLARLYLLARTLPFLKGLWWYDFQDDGWNAINNENNFGMVQPDLTPKPAWFALRSVAPLAAQAEFAGRIETADPEVWALRFRESNGAETWALWSAHVDDGWQFTLNAAGTNPAALTVCETGHEPFQRAWGARAGAVDHPERFELVVRGVPWLVSGGIAGAKVESVTRREAPEASRASLFVQ